jgi:hypothetical protein
LGFQRRVWCPKCTPAARSASSVGWEPLFCDDSLVYLRLVLDVGGLPRDIRPVARHQTSLHLPERLPVILSETKDLLFDLLTSRSFAALRMTGC